VATKSTFQSFDLWKKAHALSLELFKLTAWMPVEYQTGYVDCCRTNAISLCVQIAQAYLRKTPRERVEIYEQAMVTAERLRYCLILAKDLNFGDQLEKLLEDCDEISRIIHANMTRFAKEFA